jgi:transposase
MLKVAIVHVVRHKVRAEGLTQRQVARELNISRNTVARYLADDIEPGERVEGPRDKPVWDAVKADVFDILETSRQTKKQRLTGPVVLELLRARGKDASVRSVQRLMAEWRRQRAEVYIPLDYRPGDLAEVDFFEVTVVVGGVEQKAWMFLMRVMHSGRDFAWLYRWQDQSSFLDGHVRAFEAFGCVPHRVLYDNLKAAVRKVLVGSERLLNERFAAMAAHYSFGPRFARPATGHDKGGVEARGKAVRLQHLTPIPEGDSLADISERLMKRVESRMSEPRERGGEARAVLWEQERAEMLPLPLVAHDPSVLYDDLRVDRQAQVRVRAARYSVPCTWKRRKVRARLYPDKLVVVCDGERVERERVAGNGKNIQYRDYLPELAKKPGALEQVAHVLVKQLGDPFDRAWGTLRAQHDGLDAARRFRVVLQLILAEGEAVTAERVRRALDRQTDLVLACRAVSAPVAAVNVPRVLDQVVEVSSLAVYDALGGAR